MSVDEHMQAQVIFGCPLDPIGNTLITITDRYLVHALDIILQGILTGHRTESLALCAVVDFDVPLHGSGDLVRSVAMHV